MNEKNQPFEGLKEHVKNTNNIEEAIDDILKYNGAGDKISEDEFFKHLFWNNDMGNKDIVKKILGAKLIYPKIIHGYPRTGKSTFVKFLKYKYEKKEIFEFNNNQYLVKPVVFDLMAAYEAAQLKTEFGENTEMQYFSEMLMYYFDEFFKTIRFEKDSQKVKDFYETTFSEFVSFYDAFKNNINNNPIITYFQQIIKIFNKAEETIGKKESLAIEIFAQEIKKSFKWIREEIKKFVENKNNQGRGKVFCFLILLNIFKHGKEICNNNNKSTKLFFIVDNIDVLIKGEDANFFQNPQYEIYKFLKLLKDYREIMKNLNKALYKKNNIEYTSSKNIFDDLSIIYIFRTPNYFIFLEELINLIKNEAAARGIEDLSEHYENYESIKYPIKDISKIVHRRIEAIDKFISACEQDEPTGYKSFKSIVLNEFKNGKNGIDRDSNAYNKVFQMLNGSIDRIWDLFERGSYSKNPFFDDYSDKIVESYKGLSDYPEKLYLLKGTFIRVFLEIYKNLPTKKNMISVIKSIKNNFKLEGVLVRKSLIRIIINTIKNYDNRNNPNISGIGLYDLLFSLEELFKRIDNSGKMYKIKDVYEHLETILDGKLDYDLTLYYLRKKQFTNKGKPLNYYELSSEIDKYKEIRSGEKSEKDIKKIKDKLNGVRIHNTHLVSFFSKHVLHHFEFFAFIILTKKEDPSKHLPLLFIKKKKAIKGRITSVFEKAKHVVNNMVNFYNKQLIQEFPPQEYEDCKHFSPLVDIKKTKKKHGSFQFRKLIARHISYLESYRIAISKGLFNRHFTEVYVKDLLKFVLKKQKSYMQLYFENIERIRNKMEEVHQSKKLSYDLDKEYLIYSLLDKKISWMIENEEYNNYLRIAEKKEFVKYEIESENKTTITSLKEVEEKLKEINDKEKEAKSDYKLKELKDFKEKLTEQIENIDKGISECSTISKIESFVSEKCIKKDGKRFLICVCSGQIGLALEKIYPVN